MEPVLSILRAIALFVVLLMCMLNGIFAAVGICTLVYGPSILDTALGKPPDRTHPAFWLFMIVMVPGMLIGAVGAVFAIVLPVAARWRVAGFPGSAQHQRLLRRYLSFVGRTLTPEPFAANWGRLTRRWNGPGRQHSFWR